MQPQNPTGKPSVITRSIAQLPAVSPLEECNHPATRPASGEPPPSPPLATGHLRTLTKRNPDTRHDRVTQALQRIGCICAAGSVSGRMVQRVILQAKAIRHAA